MPQTVSKRSIVLILLSALVLLQFCSVLFKYKIPTEEPVLQRSLLQNSLPAKHISATAAPSTPDRPSSSSAANDLEALAQEIKIANEKQTIRNLDKFGPIDNQASVIVIQVHTRLDYLKLLIHSLSNAVQIDQALLIFSHDVYLPEINSVIQNITFSRVLQIFYPFSMQLHPDWFPSPDQARPPAFANSTHFRERAQQLKNHWWWKANFVFDQIPVLANYDRVITFLEEDYYVVPDFLWVLKIMEAKMAQDSCCGCDILVLGGNPYPVVLWDDIMSNETGSSSQASTASWNHNFGMAYNRTLWTKLRSCGPIFCNHNDYNWDFTLHYVSERCLKKPMYVLFPDVPRLFHIGFCGTHFKQSVCNADSEVKAIEASVAKHRKLLFPKNITLWLTPRSQYPPWKPNGSWEDFRDRELCESFISKGI